MTNAEKFKEIFGIEPDCGRCNPYPCEENDCKYWAECENQPGCPCDNWWDWEFEEPTTKDDLEVDCISREQALVAIRNLYPSMPRVDFNGSLRKWVDKYKPYIECDDAIKQLPSVTPQEPKTGHWINCKCDKCGYVVQPWNTTNYCPNCGADMRAESEET